MLFDTLTAARQLTEAGMNETRAAAVVGVLRSAVTEGVAARTDIAEVRAEVKGDGMEQQIIATWAQVGISAVGLSGIFWGLFQMQKAGRRREREIDMMSQSVKQQGEAFERQGLVLGQMLERQSQTLERQSQMLGQILERQSQILERQSQALERQSGTLGQMLERQSQALDRHGRALEELLRRSA